MSLFMLAIGGFHILCGIHILKNYDGEIAFLAYMIAGNMWLIGGMFK